MGEGDVHAIPHKDGWANEVEGKSRVSSTHETKIAAQKRGRELALVRKVEHFIHDLGGRIMERNSYGNDPRSRPVDTHRVPFPGRPGPEPRCGSPPPGATSRKSSPFEPPFP